MPELTVRLLIERDGKIEPFTGFTESERAAIRERLSWTMSAYYTQHPEEYKKSLDKTKGE